MEPLINLSNLNVILSGNHILSDVNITVFEKQIISIIGPNGAGKSTLLKCMLGLIKPTNGTVTKKKNLKIGYVPQNLQIEDSIPINVSNFLKLVPKVNTQDLSKIITRLNIEKLLNKQLQTISGGELQLVLLARALLNSPDLLVLDEPAQGVDIKGQDELYKLFKNIKHEYNCAIVLVSHDLHVVMSGTDTVVCLNKHICCSGLPEDISHNKEFINLFGKNINLALYTHQHNHKHNLAGKISNHDE